MPARPHQGGVITQNIQCVDKQTYHQGTSPRGSKETFYSAVKRNLVRTQQFPALSQHLRRLTPQRSIQHTNPLRRTTSTQHIHTHYLPLVRFGLIRGALFAFSACVGYPATAQGERRWCGYCVDA